MTAAAMVVGVVLGLIPVAPIQGSNALTLPAQRHLVRMVAPGTPEGEFQLLAVQHGGAGGRWLTLWRSDDQGAHWKEEAPIAPGPVLYRADLLVSGTDLAMVYSYEGPELQGSSAYDVYFQWW